MTLRLGDHVTDEAGLAAAPEDTVLLELPTSTYPHPLVYVKRNGLWFTDAIWFSIDPEVILAGSSDLIVVFLPGQPPRPEREVQAEALREWADAWDATLIVDGVLGPDETSIEAAHARRRADRIAGGAE